MKKVLIIHHDPQWLSNIAKYLHDYANVDFAECHSVEEAVIIIQHRSPEIILVNDYFSEQERSNAVEVIDFFQEQSLKIEIYVITSNIIAKDYYEEATEAIPIDEDYLPVFKKIAEK